MNVTIRTSAEGAHIFRGDQLNDEHGHRYECLSATGKYQDGAELCVRPLGDDAHQLLGGERFIWCLLRPGLGTFATVVKPLTRGDFDRLERKVDDLIAWQSATREGAAELTAYLTRLTASLVGAPPQVVVTTVRGFTGITGEA